MKILNNIQILRCIAAINVVFFHLIGYTFKNIQYKGVFFNFFYTWGQNGVDLFFVISGFIMIYVQDHKNRNFSSFILDRIVRIVPSYWLLTIFISLLSFILPSYFNTIVFDPKHVIVSLVFLSQTIAHQLPMLMVGWTLEFEMLFYLIFACSILIVDKGKSLFFNIVLVLVFVFLFNLPIMLEFLYGIAIGVIQRKARVQKYGTLFFTVGLSLFLLSIPLTDEVTIRYRYIIWGIPSALMVLGAIRSKQIKSRLLTTLGNISYSLYLLHYLLIPLCYKLFGYFNMGTILKSNDLIVVAVMMIILFGSFSYFKIVENPLTNFLKRRMNNGK